VTQRAFGGKLAAFFGRGEYNRAEAVQHDVLAVHVIVSAAFWDKTSMPPRA
jgi:hypothetical protein